MSGLLDSENGEESHKLHRRDLHGRVPGQNMTFLPEIRLNDSAGSCLGLRSRIVGRSAAALYKTVLIFLD
jgi:hypothetical protein